jgi:RNA polymerase sigma-70 factor (ECF subfamily)
MTLATQAAADVADAVLLEAARRGDLYAWEHVVRRYQEPVYRVAFLIVRDTAIAEEAAQSTFLRAYRALPSYDEGLGLVPWLFRIAAGESRQRRREAGRPRPTSRAPERSSGPHFPAGAVPGLDEAARLTPADREVISEAFHRLGEDDRLIIATRYLFGLSRADAAKALSIAAGLVDGQLGTAVKHLRTRMVEA